jgi:excisionase family DNA binding protein
MNNAAKQLFTVEEASERLSLHVKTVRRFIREGRLSAKRIGKEYRITRQALEDFGGAGTSVPALDPVSRTRHVTASTIVDIDAISPEESERITTLIMAGLNSRKGEPDFPRVDSLYFAERGRLRLMITASPTLTCELLRVIGALTEVSRG